MNERVVDRKRLMEIIDSDLGPDEDDDGFGYAKETSAPAPEAAPVETAPASEPSPSEPAPPSPQPQYDYSQEAKESRQMVAQLIQAQQEKERWEREQWQMQQQAQRVAQPQHDPDEYIQRNHLTQYDQTLGQMDEGLRYAIQETRELRAAQMNSEFQNALSRFQNSSDYPDFDKYVPQSVRDAAINNVQRAITQGKKFQPGEVNWADAIEREYRIHAYADLMQEKKSRAAEEAKRAEVNQKLAEVGGTPRGGAYQQAAPQKDAERARLGDHGFRSRVVSKMRELGVEF